MALETDDLAVAPTLANAALALELILGQQRDGWVDIAIANAVRACDELEAAFDAEPFTQAFMADAGIADAHLVLEQLPRSETQAKLSRIRAVLTALQQEGKRVSNDDLQTSKDDLDFLADAITTGRQLASRLSYGAAS